METVRATILNFRRVNLTNKSTGEVKTIYSVNFGVNTKPTDDFYGLAILNSYCSETVFEKLKNSVGKQVNVVIEDKKIYGKTNLFKKVVTSIDGIKARSF